MDSKDAILARHREEKKALDAQILMMRKGVNKTDKKKKKEVNAEVAILVGQMEQRQQEELHDLEASALSSNLSQVSIGEGELKTEEQKPQRISKAQKRREKKEQADREREQRIAEQEVLNASGPREIERQAIEEILKSRGLMLKEIASDGDCLYNAVRDQLESKSCALMTIWEMRNLVADYLQEHVDDFLPFLSHPETGDALSLSEYAAYVERTRSTPQWGGQVELQALSKCIEKPILVLQAEGAPVHVGEEFSGPTLIVCYHRHLCKLGEHYNSTQPFQEERER